MPLLAMKSFDEFIYSSKERTLSSWLSSIKALLGLFFCMWGGVGLALKLSSIRSTLGSIFYFSIGAYIIVSSSVRVRNYLRQIVIRALPPGSRAILFEKSLLDLFTERNASPTTALTTTSATTAITTTPVVKGITLLGLCSVLDRSDIHALIETLPAECSFLSRSGLVHLMPQQIREAICPEGVEEASQQQAAPSTVVSNLIRPIDLNDPSSEDASARQTGYFAVPSSLVVEGSGAYNRPATAVEITHTAHTNHSFGSRVSDAHPSTHVSHSGEHADGSALHRAMLFEQRLEAIIKRRINESSQWAQDRMSAVVRSHAYYLASGGDMSNTAIAGLCAAGVAGTAFMLTGAPNLTWLQRRNRRDLPLDGVMGAIQQAGSSSSSSALKNAALSCASTLAVMSGGMLFVRGMNRERIDLYDTRRRVDYGKYGLTAAASCLLRAMKRVFYGVGDVQYDDPVLYLVVAAWSLTAFLAWKLRSRVESIRWIFRIIYSNLHENAFRFIGSTQT